MTNKSDKSQPAVLLVASFEMFLKCFGGITILTLICSGGILSSAFLVDSFHNNEVRNLSISARYFLQVEST